jgi:hypothetical protein
MPDLSSSKFFTESVTVTSTSADGSADVIYTVPNNFSSIVRYLLLSNGTSSTKKAYVQFYHADDNTYHYLAKGLSMAGNSIDSLSSYGSLNLHEGDKIVSYIETGMDLDVTISVEEYYDPNR